MARTLPAHGRSSPHAVPWWAICLTGSDREAARATAFLLARTAGGVASSDEVVLGALTHDRRAWRITGGAGEHSSDSQGDGNRHRTPDEQRRHEEPHPLAIGGSCGDL